MKRNIFLFLILLLGTGVFAQERYFKGEWTDTGTTANYTILLKIKIEQEKAVGEILWIYNSSDSSNTELVDYMKGKKSKMAIEYVKGTFISRTRDLVLQGYNKKDPHNIIGIDRYVLKLSSDDKVIYGKTDNGTKYSGLFYVIEIDEKKPGMLYHKLENEI